MEFRCGGERLSRRQLLLAIAAAGTSALGAGKKPDDPRRMRPSRGDRLVLAGAKGDADERTPLRLEDLKIGAAPLRAVPIDRETGIVRDGSRLNQLLVLRFPVDALSERVVSYTAEGVVAYSGVCTHTGCPVSEWNAEAKHLVCPCHGSEFDPADRARVATGPAPRRLAVLPLRIDGGELVVRGGFRGKVGFALQ